MVVSSVKTMAMMIRRNWPIRMMTKSVIYPIVNCTSKKSLKTAIFFKLNAPFTPFRCSIVSCGKEFKLKTHLARHYAQAHGIAISSSSPRPIMKTRTAFYLHTNAMTRLARIICRHIIKPKRAARQTSYAINTQLVKQECMYPCLVCFATNIILHKYFQYF